MKKISYLVCLVFFVNHLSSQTWEENALIKNEKSTLYDFIKSFKDYKSEFEYTPGNGYNPYERKINFIE